MVGLYTLRIEWTQCFESAWFQPSSLSTSDILVSKFALTCKLYRYGADRAAAAGARRSGALHVESS
jgi:hypothetical protein